jgi:hypothetical protein
VRHNDPVSCPACAKRPDGARVTLHQGVPVHTQYMSADRIAAIVYQGADPADDPLWMTSGARTREEYGRWCRHCCGMACLRMALHHRDGHAPPMLELLRGCLAYGGYVEDDQGTIKGLYYAPFAEYARAEHLLPAEVHAHLSLDGAIELLAAERLVMASVHREIRRPHLPAPGRGGHLVLLTGYDGGLLHLHNPSGHTPQARRAVLPAEVFATFFANRGIDLDLALP